MVITFKAGPGGAHVKHAALRNYLLKLPSVSCPEMVGDEYRVITGEQDAALVMEAIELFGGTIIVPAETSS
jgi:hypothetical protein